MSASFAIIVARLAGYLSTSVLFGSPLFLLYAPGLDALRTERRSWALSATGAAAVAAAVSTLAWVMLQTASMSGDPKAAVDPAALWAFLSETPFGRAALLRMFAAGLGFSILVAVPRPSRSLWSVTAGLGAVAVTSLAWSGHGASEDGAGGAVHLAADVLHLLAAAAWVGALLALVTVVLRSEHSKAEPDAGAAEAALAGFSGVGTALVAVLVLSGGERLVLDRP